MTKVTEADLLAAESVVALWTAEHPQPYQLDGLRSRIAQAIADARGDRYERAPANIRHLLYHCLDQADKHQWFNFVHVLGELAQEAMRSLRDDLEAARTPKRKAK